MSSSPVAAVGSRRIAALDGLRGVAALVVVIAHVLQPFRLPLGYNPEDLPNATVTHRAVFWLVSSPLHALWDGVAGVVVFFVLSGYVLTRSVAGTRGGEWVSYYAKRVVRLYVPVMASTLLATALFEVVTIHRSAGVSSWLWVHQAMMPKLGVTQVVEDLLVVPRLGGINRVLWSLRIEVVFSAALPVVVWTAAKVRSRPRLAVAAALALLAVTAAGSIADHELVTYLPMFGFGVLMADHEARLVGRVAAWSSSARAVVVALAAAALSFHWWAPAIAFVVSPSRTLRVSQLSPVAMAVGAAALVVAVLASPGLQRGFSVRPLIWSGVISYSLYLVHEPIITVVASALHRWPAWAPFVALPLSLAVAAGFWLVVERPSIRAAHEVGRRSRRWARGPAGGNLP